MDSLQWFKFSFSNWRMGKIQRCSEVTQARFINLCCLYWSKECTLSYEDAEIEIDEDHLKELIKKKVILVDGDFINISFLDEQFSDIDNKSKSSKKNGEIGNLKRWHKDIYKRYENKEISLSEAIKLSKQESQPDRPPIDTRSQPDRELSQIREDKIREDKIREDKIREDKIREEKYIIPELEIREILGGKIYDSFFDDFEKHLEIRNNHKSAKNSETAINRLIKKLEKLSKGPESTKKIVQKSIKRNWADYFEFKNSDEDFYQYDVFKRCQELFSEFRMKQFNDPVAWDESDKRNLKDIMTKIYKKGEASGEIKEGVNKNEYVYSSLYNILNKWNLQSKFVRTNFNTLHSMKNNLDKIYENLILVNDLKSNNLF